MSLPRQNRLTFFSAIEFLCGNGRFAGRAAEAVDSSSRRQPGERHVDEGAAGEARLPHDGGAERGGGGGGDTARGSGLILLDVVMPDKTGYELCRDSSGFEDAADSGRHDYRIERSRRPAEGN